MGDTLGLGTPLTPTAALRERERRTERGGQRERRRERGGRETDRQTDRQKTDRQTDRQRTQNSEPYYTRIKISGSCLFLQSVPANLHANRPHIRDRQLRQRDRQTDTDRPTDRRRHGERLRDR